MSDAGATDDAGAGQCEMNLQGILECNTNPCCEPCQSAQRGGSCAPGPMCAYAIVARHPECTASCGSDNTWHFQCPQDPRDMAQAD